MPPKFVIVLGVSHRVQGDMQVFDAIDDPDYLSILKKIISDDHIDFVGEECGDNSTIAEKTANSLLEVGHYLNVNPSAGDKQRYGLGNTCFGSPLGEPLVHRWDVAQNEKLENFWINKLIERNATRGLLICGFLHAFSVAAKLLKRGLEVEARTYISEKLGSC